MIKFSDLSEQQVQEIREAFAKREDVEPIYSYALPKKCLSCNVPDYPNDLSAMHRIIFGMDDDLLTKYLSSLTVAYLTTGAVFFFVAISIFSLL